MKSHLMTACQMRKRQTDLSQPIDVAGKPKHDELCNFRAS